MGFLPTYAALEVFTKRLAKRMSSRLNLNLDSENNGKMEMKINGL